MRQKLYLIIMLLTEICYATSCGRKGIQETFGRNVADSNIIIPPSWAFGVLYGGYTNQQETIDRIEEIIQHDYPIDAYWIDSWFWSYNDKGRGPKKFIDFVADTIAFPERKKMWNFMKDNSIKGGFWIWDCILKTGNEDAFNEFLSKGYFLRVYEESNTWHNNSFSTAMFRGDSPKQRSTPCGEINFTDDSAAMLFKLKIKPFFDEGADFIKLDRTSKVETAKVMFEMTQEFGKESDGRGFIMTHSFETENEEYKRYPVKWTDDTRSDWTIDSPLVKFNTWVPNIAFKENIAMYTDYRKASSNIPFLTNDLGGFDMGFVIKPDEELYIRWLQFSMLTPITEVFAQPENPTSNLPWKYSRMADSIFRFFSHLRMQLFPYIYSYAMRSRIEGKNIICKFNDYLYQYMFGNELLVAPVYEKGIDSCSLFLPDGNWINFWTDEVFEGNKEVTISAPLNQIPLFVKQGSLIPMRKYATSVERGTNDTLFLHIFPGNDGEFKLIEDDGKSNDYLHNIYSFTYIKMKSNSEGFSIKIFPARGSFSGMRQLRKWILIIHHDDSPGKIFLNKKVMAYTYDINQKTTTVELPQSHVQELLDLKILMAK